jgi:dATP/dGTP diphosphohydrolase
MNQNSARQHGMLGNEEGFRNARWCAECNAFVHENQFVNHMDKLHNANSVLRNHTEDVLVAAPSGATSSKLDDFRYDLVPPSFLRRVAARFGLGVKKGHLDYNWRKGVADPVFIQSRINHLEHHWNLYKTEGNKKDDNLGAIAWGIAMLMEFEQHPQGMRVLEQVLRTLNFESSPADLASEKELKEQRGL